MATFLNNSVINWPILTIFGSSHPEKIPHQALVDLSTLPVSCSHFTLGNPKKIIFQNYSYAQIYRLLMFILRIIKSLIESLKSVNFDRLTQN